MLRQYEKWMKYNNLTYYYQIRDLKFLGTLGSEIQINENRIIKTFSIIWITNNYYHIYFEDDNNRKYSRSSVFD